MAFSVTTSVLQVPEDVLVKMVWVSLDPNARTGPHSHYTLELSMIVSGRGEYRVGEQVYPVQAGDIVLFNNTETHGMWNTGREPLENVALEFEPRFIWFDSAGGFDKALLAAFMQRSKGAQNRLDRNSPLFSSIQRQFQDIEREFEQKLPRRETVIRVKLMALLADLMRYYDAAPRVPAGQSRHHQDMNRVLNYIAEHYNEPVSLEPLAEMMQVNESYFCRIFREINGISPKEYIVKMRIAAASTLLKKTDRGVLDIAAECGFNSLSNFYTAFKRITGQSPAQYRKHPLE